MKKEALSIMIIKALLAVIIFAGVGTIIIGGAWLVGKQETGVQDNAEEAQQKAVNLVKSQKLLSDMEVYESIRSSDSFKTELKSKILTKIKEDFNLSSAYQNNKEESDKIIETIVNLKTAVSFSAETLDNGNVKINVFLGPDSTEMEKYPQDSFTFEYPDGWEIAENYFYETAAGIRAKNPTVVLQEIDDDDSNNRIVINQRQFDCELGKCAEVDYITIGTYSKNSEVLNIFNRIAESFSSPRSNS